MEQNRRLFILARGYAVSLPLDCHLPQLPPYGGSFFCQLAELKLVPLNRRLKQLEVLSSMAFQSPKTKSELNVGWVEQRNPTPELVFNVGWVEEQKPTPELVFNVGWVEEQNPTPELVM